MSACVCVCIGMCIYKYTCIQTDAVFASPSTGQAQTPCFLTASALSAVADRCWTTPPAVGPTKLRPHHLGNPESTQLEAACIVWEKINTETQKTPDFGWRRPGEVDMETSVATCMAVPRNRRLSQSPPLCYKPLSWAFVTNPCCRREGLSQEPPFC